MKIKYLILLLLTSYCFLPTCALATGQAGVGARPLGMGGLLVLPAKEDQVICDKNQNYCSGCQINICFHKLFSPLVNKINKNQKQAANNSCEKISIYHIPFNHNCTSLTKLNEIKKEINAITMDIMNVNIKSKKFCGRTSNEALSNCPEVKSIANYNNIEEIMSQ